MHQKDLNYLDKTGIEDEVSIPERFADKFRMQGAIWAFCTLLRNTDNTEMIYFLYQQIIESGYDKEVPEGKQFLPSFMLEHAVNNNVDFNLLFQKMIWILKEHDDDDWAFFCDAISEVK